uniref:Uncharacterized protein n=1 Tax=Lepeophtheirus salmonis TaxID=72036 RepID=A0A0K2TJ91_LEPSM
MSSLDVINDDLLDDFQLFLLQIITILGSLHFGLILFHSFTELKTAEERKMELFEPFHHLNHNDLSMEFNEMPPPFYFKEKPTLFSDNLNNLVEMFYWFVKFIGDYEKSNGKETRIVGKNARYIIKLGRYVLKYIKSYEKIKKE